MITPQEFVQQWGAQGLAPLFPDAFTGTQIAIETRRFLIEAGLPCEAGLGLEFNLDAHILPTLPEALEDASLAPRYNRYRPIGVDDATTICIDEKDDSHVYAVDVDENIPTRFVNSSVPQLAESLLVFRQDAGAELSKFASNAELNASADALEQALRRIDGEAMDREDGWWPLIVMQRRDGLL